MSVFSKNILAVLLLPLFFAGCGGGAQNESTGRVVVMATPSLGKIKNGNVQFISQEGNVLQTVNTGTAGQVYFTLVNGYSRPFILKVCGAPGATYFDEGLGAELPLAANQCLRAVVPNLDELDVGISAFTEAATRILERQGILATATASQAKAALETVRQKVGMAGSVLLAPALAGTSSELSLLINAYLQKTPLPSMGDVYALESGYRLSVLAKVAVKQSVERGVTVTMPAYDIADALARDLADGLLDGQDANGYIISSVYDIHALNKWIAAAAKDEYTILLGTGFPGLDLTTADGLAWLSSHGYQSPAVFNVTLPAKGNALMSWQGKYDGTIQATSGDLASLKSDSLLNPPSQKYGNFFQVLTEGGACSVELLSGTVRFGVSDGEGGMIWVPYTVPYTATAASGAGGIRTFTFNDAEEALSISGKVVTGTSSLVSLDLDITYGTDTPYPLSCQITVP